MACPSRLAQLSRYRHKTALTAAAAAVLGASGWYSNEEKEEQCNSLSTKAHLHSLLPPQRIWPSYLSSTLCEAPKADAVEKTEKIVKPKSSDPTDYAGGGHLGDVSQDENLYHGLFPRRQLWRPRLEYPLWDYEWDGRQPPPLDADSSITESQRNRQIRREGVTKHIILIRHGQYDETYPEDEKRLLTPLGRKQAKYTGKRLGEYIRGINEEYGPCKVKVLRVSDLTRAKETAQIIYDNFGETNGIEIEMAKPDPSLNEGRPCHHIPGGRARQSVIERTDEHHPRIENAFRTYFHRAPLPTTPEANVVATSTLDKAPEHKLSPHPRHEFEIIVCHANVIRYFFCRALQLPPEAWLRLCVFNCSLTYFTIRPTGTVSCRMLGDIGHLPYDLSTFSMHTGFNW